MTHNPFIVSCPDCGAPAGERCRIRSYTGPKGRKAPQVPNDDGKAVHANRRDSARLRLAVRGTCSLCGRFMVQATDPDRTWHPDYDLDMQPIPQCPPPPPTALVGQLARYIPSGPETFIPDPTQPDPPEDQPNPPPALDLPEPEPVDGQM